MSNTLRSWAKRMCDVPNIDLLKKIQAALSQGTAIAQAVRSSVVAAMPSDLEDEAWEGSEKYTDEVARVYVANFAQFVRCGAAPYDENGFGKGAQPQYLVWWMRTNKAAANRRAAAMEKLIAACEKAGKEALLAELKEVERKAKEVAALVAAEEKSQIWLADTVRISVNQAKLISRDGKTAVIQYKGEEDAREVTLSKNRLVSFKSELDAARWLYALCEVSVATARKELQAAHDEAGRARGFLRKAERRAAAVAEEPVETKIEETVAAEAPAADAQG